MLLHGQSGQYSLKALTVLVTQACNSLSSTHLAIKRVLQFGLVALSMTAFELNRAAKSGKLSGPGSGYDPPGTLGDTPSKLPSLRKTNVLVRRWMLPAMYSNPVYTAVPSGRCAIIISSLPSAWMSPSYELITETRVSFIPLSPS